MTTDLDSWLATIAGVLCGACNGSELDNTGEKWCNACHGQGRTWPIPLWEVCGPLSDWLEEQGDYIRAKLVRPRLFDSGTGLSASRPSVITGNHSWADWSWLPDPKPPQGMKKDQAHITVSEAARRLKLLWRKPLVCKEVCGAIHDPACDLAGGPGYFPKTLIIGDGPVEVPEESAVCPCGARLGVTWKGVWVGYCTGRGGLAEPPAITKAVEIAEQWAANHLILVPKEVLT